MKTLSRGVLALGLLIACPAVDAFGPKTHLWIGDQVLSDLRDGCALKLASGAYRVSPDLCQAITSNPESFRAGAVGPDIYPDVIAGQNTTHSGVKGGWETAEFLEHVVASANTPSARAYAAGYLVHAAADVFGHSYINIYAGDVWNVREERAVELRHMVIEKYIDAHLPLLSPDAASFHAPPDFVRDTLIHSGKVQPQYRRAAVHLASMTSVKAIVDDLAARTDAITNVVPEVLAKSVELATALAGQLIDGEAALGVASAALEVAKAGADAQRAFLDGARKAVADAVGAVDEHETRMAELGDQAEARQREAAAADAAARQATAAAAEIRSQLSALESQIRSVPPKIVVNVCHQAAEQMCATVCPEGSSNPLCAVCSVPRGVCAAVERINDEYQRLNDQITRAKERLGELEAVAAAETEKADAATASAGALRQQQATESAAGAGLAAAEATAEAEYRGADEQYNSSAANVVSAQRRVDELRLGAAATRRQLVDARAVGDQLRSFSARLNVLAHLLRNWQTGIDHAGSAFVGTSDRVGQGMLEGRLHLFSEYGRWLACDGAVYLAEPYQVADVPCYAETAVQQLQAAIRDLASAVLPGPLQDIYDRLDELRSRIDTELRAAVNAATTELVRFVSDRTTADFVDLLVNPEHATRAKLNEVLATAGDVHGKDILVFEDGAGLIDRDIGLRNGTLDPNEFAALAAAVTLAKLSLLDQAEMKRLVAELGGAEAQAAYDAGKFDVGRSILITAVRSLDGNEQWQPYGLLYPRSSGGGGPTNASDRHYGFGPGDASRRGFPLFVDPVLRQRVFAKLFPRQIHGEVAERPEMAPGRYAFAICESNPFPVTFLPSGEPAADDHGCSARSPRTGAR